MIRIQSIRWGLGAVALLAGVACGGDDAPVAQGAPMSGGALTEALAPSGPNDAPVVTRVAVNPRNPMPGMGLQAIVEASDPNGDPIRLKYIWKVNGATVFEGKTPVANLPNTRKGDRITLEVVASDGRLESRPTAHRVDVANRPPTIAEVYLESEGRLRPGDELVASPDASDPDGDRLEYNYRWFVNRTERANESDRTFDTTGLRKGDRIEVRATAFDGSDRSKESTSQPVLLGNGTPRITQLPQLETTSGTMRYAFAAEDPDGDRNLRFFLEAAPEGMRVDSLSGVLTWTPRADQAGVHPVEIGVKDSLGEASTFLFEVTVTATLPPAAPPAALAD